MRPPHLSCSYCHPALLSHFPPSCFPYLIVNFQHVLLLPPLPHPLLLQNNCACLSFHKRKKKKMETLGVQLIQFAPLLSIYKSICGYIQCHSTPEGKSWLRMFFTMERSTALNIPLSPYFSFPFIANDPEIFHFVKTAIAKNAPNFHIVVISGRHHPLFLLFYIVDFLLILKTHFRGSRPLYSFFFP